MDYDQVQRDTEALRAATMRLHAEMMNDRKHETLRVALGMCAFLLLAYVFSLLTT